MLNETHRYRDGEPCSHRGCLSHVSHPCEGCGRIAGRTPAPRDPAAGATPAREETERDAREWAETEGHVMAYWYGPRFTDEDREMVRANMLAYAKRAALRERDAAREDAARLDWLGSLRAFRDTPWTTLHELNGEKPASWPSGIYRTSFRQAIDAARAAAEGGTP